MGHGDPHDDFIANDRSRELLGSELPLGPLRLARLYALVSALGPADALPGVSELLYEEYPEYAERLGLDPRSKPPVSPLVIPRDEL